MSMLTYVLFVPALTSLIGILVVLPKLLAAYLGWYTFNVSDIVIINRICDQAVLSTGKTDSMKAFDVVIGSWFVGLVWFDKERKSELMMVFMSLKQFTQISENIGSMHVTDSSQIMKIFTRRGHFYHLYYNFKTISLPFEPKPEQKAIVDTICAHMKAEATKSGVFYIAGAPGRGKTHLAFLVAHRLGLPITKSFRPTDPGDQLDTLESTIGGAFVLLLDEFDVLIDAVHHGKIKRHKDIPICVYDKPSLNSWLDDIAMGLYPGICVIMTANRTREVIDLEYDPSYLRDGRVTEAFVMT